MIGRPMGPVGFAFLSLIAVASGSLETTLGLVLFVALMFSWVFAIAFGEQE